MTFDEIIDHDKPVLVDFFAEWCGPCKLMPPILKEVKDRLGDDVRIVKIDVDKNQAIAERFQVRGVPTLIIFKNKTAVWRQPGVLQASVLEQQIQTHLNA
jgi:thioredoxin 1